MSWKIGVVTIVLFTIIGGGLVARYLFQRTDTNRERSQGSGATASATSPAALSKSDQELIGKQKTCPVSGEALGSMGQPVKVEVKGRVVFLCCDGCKKDLLADPDKYLKKLDEKKNDEKK